MLLTLFCSCGQSDVYQGRKVYKAYFQKHLKDPESFKVYEEKYEVLDEHTVRWTLDYGAKNSWGAMERETVTFETCFSMLIKDGEIWNMNKH